MVPDIHNDTLLLQQIAAGDTAAFRTLFRRYKDRFYALALKMTRSEDLAEEITQQVFVTLWIRRELLAGIDNPSSYLFRIVYNSIYAHFKKLAAERRLKKALLDLGPDEVLPFEDLLLRDEQQELLDRAIDTLPTQQQRVFRLCKLQGLSREQAAAAMGISPNTVKNHLREATRSIQSWLERAIPLLVFILLRRGR